VSTPRPPHGAQDRGAQGEGPSVRADRTPPGDTLGSSLHGAPPVWDFALCKQLRHGERSFQLDMRCQSSAPRLVLFGPSGAGKTQTLKMLAGLVQPDAGHVRLQGDTLYDSGRGLNRTPQQRRLAYMFQDYALFPHLNVRQNIGFALRQGWRNPPGDLAHARVEHWLEVFGLQAVAGQYPPQLSGGQRQRTALARALVAEPRALLLDEPFAALDKRLRAHLRAELAELQRRLALPMLLITHDDDDLHALADVVVEVDAGAVVGTPAAGSGDNPPHAPAT
jgi:molybdate transport system ATP-binding protein